MRQVVEKRAHLVADARYKVRQAAQRLARLSHISHPEGFLRLLRALDQPLSIADQIAQPVNLIHHRATLARQIRATYFAPRPVGVWFRTRPAGTECLKQGKHDGQLATRSAWNA